MLRRSVMVERDAQLEHCFVMERTRIGRGAHVRRAIIDQDNDITPGERIGLDPAGPRTFLGHRERCRGGAAPVLHWPRITAIGLGKRAERCGAARP